MRRPQRTVVVAASSLLACGDVIDGAAPGIGLGTAAIAWSVAGSRDPVACNAYGAPSLRIVVHDTADVVRAERVVPCNAFGTDLTLRAGLYRVSATFEDARGVRSSATARVGPFVVEVESRADVALVFTEEMMDTRKIVLTTR